MSAMQSEKMRVMPVHKLLLTMSLPAIISMMVQALYNVVDSIFVARIGEQALEALSIAFPMQMLIISFGTGLGVGANAVIARKLGEKKKEQATLAAQTGLFIILITIVIFVFAGAFLAKPFIKAFSTDSATIAMGAEYLSFVLMFSAPAFVDLYFGRVFQSMGNMKVPMIGQLAGAITNMILDPLLIFGIGFPALGVKGAAIATVIGQIVAMSIGLSFFIFAKQDIKPFFTKSFRLKAGIAGEILKIGIPSILLKSLNSVAAVLMNVILKAYAYGITILGVYFRLQSFVLMPIFGLMQGALPILSYNYGAKQKQRFTNTFKLALFSAFGLLLIGIILFQVIPEPLMRLFDADGALLAAGVKALRINSVSFLFAAVGITVTITFQSLGNGVNSLLMSLLRQLALLLPSAYILSRFFGMDGVWLAFPIAEFVVAAIFMPIIIRTINKSFPADEFPVTDAQPKEAAAEQDMFL